MKVGFDAGFQRFTTEGGLPAYVTNSGSVIPLTIGARPAALHDDPSFEDPTFSDYDGFWSTGSPILFAETDDVLEADQALGIALDDTESQIIMSSVFVVTPGDTVTFGVWASAADGAPVLKLGLLTRVNEVPNIFDSLSSSTESGWQSLASGYAQQSFSAQVPAGDNVARIYFRVEPTDGDAATALLDLSFSAVTGNVVSEAA